MNVAEKLARELCRVTELRLRYIEVGKMPNVIVQPAVMLMELAIEQGCIAAGCNDALIQMDAVRELEGFKK